MTYNPFSVQFLKSALRYNKLWLSTGRGQNYLIDKNIAEKIVSFIPEGSVIFEAGSGLGALTSLLFRKFKTYSIEIDGGIYNLLKEYLAGDNLLLINGDFLKIDLSVFGEKEFFFVSNAPYSIAGELIRKFTGDQRFRTGLCMLQDEMVQRMLAEVSSASYGPFAILTSLFLSVRKLFQVGRQSFYPAPSVDSAVVMIQKKSLSLPQDDFNIFLRKGFLARRKTLYNNMKNLGFSAAVLEGMGINPALRPQDIAPADWERLYYKYVALQ